MPAAGNKVQLPALPYFLPLPSPSLPEPALSEVEGSLSPLPPPPVTYVTATELNWDYDVPP